MLIHSIWPIMLSDTQDDSPPGVVMRQMPFGHVEGYDTPNGFMIQRMHTTDISRYLDKSYAPGNIISNQK